MAAKYPQAPIVAATQSPRHVSITDFERALEYLTQQVAERKRQLGDTFRQIHEMVAQREVTPLAELDAIPVDIAEKINERKVSLEELIQLKEETEKKLKCQLEEHVAPENPLKYRRRNGEDPFRTDFVPSRVHQLSDGRDREDTGREVSHYEKTKSIRL